jgi:hypothetical protein
LDAQPFSTPHTEPRVKGLVGQLSGYLEVEGASGRTRPLALFGQKLSLRVRTFLPALSVRVISEKPGSPEKSFTVPVGSFFALALPPSYTVWVTVTGSL